MKIKVLPQSIANMIAAGEVVERPASVVKELTENSIDAGATSVTIEIKQGGMSYIRVTDDGSGIPSDQAETAFLRHATSKISKADDLSAIYTLGFRGEALASIAAVARVDIFTKTKDEDFGICLSIEGGQVLLKDDAGCSDGTTIIVRDLFFNTPARMKFLKSDATETGYITDVVNKLILGHPEVKIKLIVNGRVTVSSPGDALMESAIYTVYGKDYPPHLIPVDYKEDGLEVTGFVGTQEISRKDRRGQVFFINSRYITSKIISAALSEAFQNFIMTGRFPVAVLNIKVKGSFVDVNVHPTKIEVRFSDEKKVYHSIYWAVKNALSQKKHIPEASLSKATASDKVREEKIKVQNSATQLDINLLRDSFYKTGNAPAPQKEALKRAENKESSLSKEREIPRHIRENAFFSKEELNLLNSPLTNPKEEKSSEAKPEQEKKHQSSDPILASLKAFESSAETKKDASFEKAQSEQLLSEDVSLKKDKPDSFADAANIKEPAPRKENEQRPAMMLKAGVDFIVIGQVFATYILVQKDREMLIIDQHAAQERLYFEELLKDYETREIYSQRLLIPAAIDLEPASFPLVWENREFLESLGFECEEFGESTVLVRSVPSIISDSDIDGAFREIIALLEKGCESITKAILEDVLHTMACKRAIKGNSALSRKEMESLSQKVLSFDYINTCPHGRPICISMSEYEVEKQFKRV